MRIITINAAEPAPPPPHELPPPPELTTPTPVVPRPDPGMLASEGRLLASDDLIPIDSDVPIAADSAPESLELADSSQETVELEVESDRPTPVAPIVRPFDAVPEPEDEEVNFEEDALTPATPRVVLPDAFTHPSLPEDESLREPERVSELSQDDVVAVESAPASPPFGSPPLRMRPQSSQPPSAPSAPGAQRTTGTLPPPSKPSLVIVPPHVGTLGPAATEASGLRRKGRLWWEDLFNDDYLRACEKLTDEQIAREVDFVESRLGIERGGALLDLGCGTGRHAIELARRGYEVVGFDLSLPMLARAGDEAQERDAKLNFVQGDMREMSFEEQFDGVYCWNTSFGYFEEDKNAGVIERIHKALRAGGLFLLDVVNRDYLVRHSPSLAWFEGDGCVCMDEMNVDFITSRMRVKRTMMLDDGRSREIEYSMRVYSLHELGKLLHEHGFKVTEVSGRTSTPGVFFGNESPRTIILAEKR
jgi:SAM-dependent methyltransferase